MKIFIATDIVASVSGNRIFVEEQQKKILTRYHDAFGKFVLCSRFSNTDGGSDSLVDITDLIDSVVKISSLLTALLGRHDEDIKSCIEECDLVVGRCPSIVANRAFKVASKCKKKFFSEVMGCAWDAYWNHSLAGKILAPYMFFCTKRTIKHSDYALYVTQAFLQKRYPCLNESVGVSNVFIPSHDDDLLNKRLENINKRARACISLMTTAAVNVKYKGQEYVIKAIPKLNERGIKVKYYLAGGGDQSRLSRIAKKLGVENQVVFLGRLSHSQVLSYLTNVDVYIQPSLQEGLPRAMIEAMSCACPCIGAKTAGIPELISEKYVVKRRSHNDIVNKLLLMSDNEIAEEQARLNFEKSKEYADCVLFERRERYYTKVKKDLWT